MAARYVAFLRGVSPMNARMPEVKAAFEAGGFTEVKTLLSSGNVVFSAKAGLQPAALQRKAEAAMTKHLDRSFSTIVRPALELQRLLAGEPFGPGKLPANAKRVITFLREAKADDTLTLPVEFDGARIVAKLGNEIFSFYVPSPRGPAFMTLIERSFGKDVTTRTWETVMKCVAAAELGS
jgi:uncharacterized protein (DUF1697 family)